MQKAVFTNSGGILFVTRIRIKWLDSDSTSRPIYNQQLSKSTVRKKKHNFFMFNSIYPGSSVPNTDPYLAGLSNLESRTLPRRASVLQDKHSACVSDPELFAGAGSAIKIRDPEKTHNKIRD